MASETKKRELFKGSLQSPKRIAQPYTQKPASNEEVLIMSRGKKDDVIVEFNSRAIPQPFLDPSILQLRQRLQKQWAIDQEKTRKAGESSGAADTHS